MSWVELDSSRMYCDSVWIQFGGIWIYFDSFIPIRPNPCTTVAEGGGVQACTCSAPRLSPKRRYLVISFAVCALQLRRSWFFRCHSVARVWGTRALAVPRSWCLFCFVVVGLRASCGVYALRCGYNAVSS
jgi:hypothetical protein